MMKYFFLTFFTLFSISSALASSDSVAFFYRPNKVIVLINERIESGHRLSDFMDHFGTGDELLAQNAEGSIEIRCGKGSLGASCTFSFLKAPGIQIQNRELLVKTSSRELGLIEAGTFEMSFAGSMNDKFDLTVNQDGSISMSGSKKLRH